MMHQAQPRSAFHAGQFVKVQLTSQTFEVGQIESLEDTTAVVLTSAGFRVTRTITALSPAWLVVVDLNGVLGYRQTSKVFKKRPHVDQLLKFLFKNFVVGVWTSCTEANGRRIISDVFGEQEHRLLFKMFRDECTPNPTLDNQYGTFKDLRRVWDRYPAFNAANTIMVDDSEDKCSHRHNAVCPTPYSSDLSATAEAADMGLQEIVTVLEAAVAVGTLEPLRAFMLKRWMQENPTPPVSVSPITCGAADPPPTSGPHSPPPPGWDRSPVPQSGGRPPIAVKNTPPPTNAAASGPFGSSMVQQGNSEAMVEASRGGSRAAGGRHAGSAPIPAPRSRRSGVQRQLAKQDAFDSDDGRPSMGNTPIASGIAGIISSPMHHHESDSLPVDDSRVSPPERPAPSPYVPTHDQHALSPSDGRVPPTTGTNITDMMKRIAMQRSHHHAQSLAAQRNVRPGGRADDDDD